MIFKCLLFALFQVAIALFVVVHAQDQSGFISIDCGSDTSNYKDETTRIVYNSDAGFTDSGTSVNISSNFSNDGLSKQYLDVRSFPDGKMNCYKLRPPQGKGGRYLIRAGFLYGNYDSRGQLPEFDLYVGVNFWDTINFTSINRAVTTEIVYVSPSDYVDVCLADKGLGTPFISLLELRTLNNGTYSAGSGALKLTWRLDCGTDGPSVRYPDDVFDRIWQPFSPAVWKNISTNFTVRGGNGYRIPSPVMRTAATLNNGSAMGISWSSNTSAEYYIFMHFAEIENLSSKALRQFNILQNGGLWYGPFSPSNLSIATIYSTGPWGPYPKFQILINKTENSTRLPLLNAIEIYELTTLLQSQTDQKDVDAINNIKSMYGVKKDWEGDPCAPKDFMWNGLNCNFSGLDAPSIISLNLSGSELTGEIAPYIANLTMITSLDLSNNSLNGTVPDFLSQLPFLTILNLEGNNLSGVLPQQLVERSKNGSLALNVDKNPNLCRSEPCGTKRNNKTVLIAVVASVGGFFILSLVVAAIVLWRLRRRKQAANASFKGATVESSGNGWSLGSKKQQFTYSEVLIMTNNFQRVLGKGGFGTVYHGDLDGIEVAVKILSPSAAQGYKQFRAEAQRLARVHHRNLTSLVGFCDEGSNIALIYEYMGNGNLAQHLFDRNAIVLSWEERLRIAVDAAQGLEYLHDGCKPSIIHRDIKSTNILLNESFQAKLADFGLSRVFPSEEDGYVSTVVVGTPGYLDPEYSVSNRLNEKSDVYSFGVVLLEMITGQLALDRNQEQFHIIQRVRLKVGNGDIESLVDPRLEGNFDVSSIWKAVEAAMDCASPAAVHRPTMGHVVSELRQCLAMEMARTSERQDTKNGAISDSLPLNEQDEQAPLPR